MFEDDVATTHARLVDSSVRLRLADDLAAHAWAKHQASTAPYAAQLCDQLRLILEPTEASRLKGDYKTGKRLNMRKVRDLSGEYYLVVVLLLLLWRDSRRSSSMIVIILFVVLLVGRSSPVGIVLSSKFIQKYLHPLSLPPPHPT